MTVVSRPLYRALLVAGLVATVFTAGCKKKPIAEKPKETAPVEQPKPQPTVTLSADPTSISKGDSSTLSWTSINATQLTIAPEVGTVTAEGSTKVTPADSTTYTITASGPGGSGSRCCGPRRSSRRSCPAGKAARSRRTRGAAEAGKELDRGGRHRARPVVAGAGGGRPRGQCCPAAGSNLRSGRARDARYAKHHSRSSKGA